MSPLYLKAVNLLVEKGVYSSRGDVIREGLRLVFQRHNLNLFGFVEGRRSEDSLLEHYFTLEL